MELPLNICAGCVNLGFLQCSVRGVPFFKVSFVFLGVLCG